MGFLPIIHYASFRILLLFFCLAWTPVIRGEDGSQKTIEIAVTTLDNAHEAYQRNYKDSPTGEYKDGKILFLIREFSAEGNSQEDLELRTLPVFHEALLDYAAKRYARDNPPNPPLLTVVFPDLLPLLRTESPTLGVFPLNYSRIPVREMCSEIRGDMYRYAVALPIRSLEESLPDEEFRHAVPTESDVEHALQVLWGHLAEKRQLAVLCDLFSLPEDRLSLANQSLREHLNCDSFSWGTVPVHTLYAAYARSMALGESISLDSLSEASAGMPVPARSLASWAGTAESPQWTTINARLLALTGEDARDSSLNGLSNPEKKHSRVAGEYSIWLSSLAARPWPKLLDGIFSGIVTTGAWRTLGHANFPTTAPEEETSEYREAKQLFDAGKELSKLTGLLLRGLENSPRHAASWALLGDTLWEFGENKDAFWPLAQALRLSPNDGDTRTSLALIYQAVGCHEWAAGMAASVFAQPVISEWSRKNALNVLEESSKRAKPSGESKEPSKVR